MDALDYVVDLADKCRGGLDLREPLVTTVDGEQLQSLRTALLRVPSSAHEESEDLVQEAFLRALSRPDVDPDRLKAWLLTVVRNLGNDAFRRNRSASTAMARLAKSELPEPDPADAVVDDDQAKCVVELVEALPPLQREVLKEVAKGRTIEQAAHATGLSARGAEGHLRRARAVLRRKMNA